MEVMHNTDFDFKTPESSPYSTIPSTPTRIGDYYYSAPTSPSRVSTYYQDFDDFLVVNEEEDEVVEEIVKDCGASVPFKWEEKPGKPKYLSQLYKKSEDDFMFDVGPGMERSSVSADEIFAGGKIRPHFSNQENDERMLNREKRRRIRGSHRRTQSVSAPEITSEYEFKEEESKQPELNKESESESSSSSKGFSKWSFKDLFLFRSASEGRASDKDPLHKYMPFYKKQEFYKRSSFRAIDSPNGSRTGSMRHVSAHELHYTLNRAVSEDLKKKTFLPYKQGILGRLAFNPALHAIANGFGISHR
jgi:hypothetical protein